MPPGWWEALRRITAEYGMSYGLLKHRTRFLARACEDNVSRIVVNLYNPLN